MHLSNSPSRLIKQKGAALVVFFMAIILAGAVFLVSTIDSNNANTQSENITSVSLSKAKGAVISFAISYYIRQSTASNPLAGFHGMLPCPDPVGNGNSASCGTRHTNSIGRIPWKYLEIEPLKDSSGECLWYAVSGGFYNDPKSYMANDDTPGMFQVLTENGDIMYGATPEDRVVAVIIAPGKPLANQNRRSAEVGRPCKVTGDNVVASDYLETYLNVSNSSVSKNSTDTVDQFISASSFKNNPALNDRIITITAGEIFSEIKNNTTLYTKKINELADTISNCLILYANNSHEEINQNLNPSTTTDQCRADCDADRDLCLISATTGQKIASCNLQRVSCRASCNDGNSGNGGGQPPVSGNSYYLHLPWPAPVNLADDYRVNGSYTDQASAANIAFGRLPISTENSNDAMSISSNPDIFNSCDLDINVDEMGRLWNHWKDHWFYVVGKDYQPSLNTTPASSSCAAGMCPTEEVSAKSYAALLIFSNQRIETAPYNQLRQDPYIEIGAANGNLKSEINNYLEGSNITGGTNFGDFTGSPLYNDRIYCLSVETVGSTTVIKRSYEINSNNLPLCN